MQNGKADVEIQLTREISARLVHMMSSVYTEVEFEEIDGSQVCVIWVDPSRSQSSSKKTSRTASTSGQGVLLIP